MNEELNNIRKVLEKVLAEKYPNFPKEVIFKILEIQIAHSNSFGEAQKRVNAYLTEYFNEHPDVKIQ